MKLDIKTFKAMFYGLPILIDSMEKSLELNKEDFIACNEMLSFYEGIPDGLRGEGIAIYKVDLPDANIPGLNEVSGVDTMRISFEEAAKRSILFRDSYKKTKKSLKHIKKYFDLLMSIKEYTEHEKMSLQDYFESINQEAHESKE